MFVGEEYNKLSEYFAYSVFIYNKTIPIQIALKIASLTGKIVQTKFCRLLNLNKKIKLRNENEAKNLNFCLISCIVNIILTSMKSMKIKNTRFKIE